jgi:hypothetical protein
MYSLYLGSPVPSSWGQGRDHRVLHAGGVVVATLQERGDHRLLGRLRQDVDRTEAQVFVVVIQGVEGHQPGLAPGRRFDDRERLAPDERGIRRQGRRDPLQGLVRGVLLQPLHGGQDHGRISVGEHPGDLVDEARTGEDLQRGHGGLARLLAVVGEEGEEGLGRRLPGDAVQEDEAGLLQPGVLVGREPPDVDWVEALERRQFLEQLVAFGLALPAAGA